MMKKMEINLLAKNLVYYRKGLGLTQSELATLAGVAFSTIQTIERVRTVSPRMDTLQKISDALEITVDNLIDRGVD